MSQPTVNVPAVGPVQRRWVVAGAAVVAVIVGYAYWTRGRSSSAGVAYDPTTGSAISPGTGYVNPVPDGPGSDPVVVDDSVIRTDAQWSAVAYQRLTDANWDGMFTAVTLGKFLTGQQLTPQEIALIQAAYALAGYPPSNPPIHAAPLQQPPPSSTPPPPSSTPPPPSSSKPGVSSAGTIMAGAGTNLYWVSDTYFGGDFGKLESMNPGIRSIIRWSSTPQAAPYDAAYIRRYGNLPITTEFRQIRVQ